ncbi:MAG: ABC transporter permease subunit [Clostridiales bacterium]|nr:ABC transporter permease subunit [Clostridiales bacterium]
MAKPPLKSNAYENRRTLSKAIREYRTMYLFLLPALACVAVFAYVPMTGIIMAFQDYSIIKGISGSDFVGIKHFIKFFTDPAFYAALKNTVGISLLSLLFGFPIPIMFAIMIFSMRDSLFKRITQTISYLPHFVSWVVVASIVYKILDPNTGVVNVISKAMGGEAVNFMRDPAYFWGLLIGSSIWKELGWNSILYLAALSAVPPEQYESAVVDGAGGFQKLIFITLPGIAPTIGLMLIFTIGSLFNVNFDAVYNLRNPLLSATANTIDYYVYQEGVLNDKISFATAIGLAQSAVALALVTGSNALSRKIRGYGAF